MDSSPDASTGDVVGSALEGLWQTEGYGWIYSIEDGEVRIYEPTAISCVQIIGGTVIAETEEQARIDLEVPGAFIIGMDVLSGDQEDVLHFLADGLLISPPAHRLAALPDPCLHPSPTDDVHVFDVIAQTFEEHYALFADREVAWETEALRARLTRAEPDPLLDVVVELLAPLEDAHVSVQGPDGGFEGWRVESDPVTEAMIEQGRGVIAENYLVEPAIRGVDEQLAFGLLPGNVGYLAAEGFGPLFSDGRLDYRQGLEEVETFLDEAFAQQDLVGLVVDLRTNGGGSDLYGLAMAERLTEEPYTAYQIRARIDPEEREVFSEPVPILVEPSDRPGFSGPVVMLIGRHTVSAGETLALAVRGRDDVTLVGEPTQGAFSSVLNHFLPNGWMLGLPNEQYLSREGDRFDVVGIPPDVTTAVFSQEDLDLGRDSGLEEALRILLP